jgi:predicted RNA-binding protein with PIN domain
MVEETRERRSLMVVTSDRALGDYVRRCGARVLRAGEFRRRMDDALADGSSDEHERDAGPDVAAGEMKGWMRYFGVGPDDDDD